MHSQLPHAHVLYGDVSCTCHTDVAHMCLIGPCGKSVAQGLHDMLILCRELLHTHATKGHISCMVLGSSNPRGLTFTHMLSGDNVAGALVSPGVGL